MNIENKDEGMMILKSHFSLLLTESDPFKIVNNQTVETTSIAMIVKLTSIRLMLQSSQSDSKSPEGQKVPSFFTLQHGTSPPGLSML